MIQTTLLVLVFLLAVPVHAQTTGRYNWVEPKQEESAVLGLTRMLAERTSKTYALEAEIEELKSQLTTCQGEVEFKEVTIQTLSDAQKWYNPFTWF